MKQHLKHADSKMNPIRKKSGIKKQEILPLPKQSKYTDEQLLKIESAYILPRARALVEKFGSMDNAARNVVRLDPRMKWKGVKQAIQHTLSDRLTTKKPIKWGFPWPYDFINDKSLSQFEPENYEQ